MIGFNLKVEEENNIPTIHLKGELDIHSSQSLDQTIQALVNKHATKIILNMQDIQYMDSTGLGTIAKNAKKLSESNGEMIISGSQPRIKQVFEFSGLLGKENIKLIDNH